MELYTDEENETDSDSEWLDSLSSEQKFSFLKEAVWSNVVTGVIKPADAGDHAVASLSYTVTQYTNTMNQIPDEEETEERQFSFRDEA